jgi:hypothetical protein
LFPKLVLGTPELKHRCGLIYWVQKLQKISRKLFEKMLKPRLNNEILRSVSLVKVASTTLVYITPLCNRTTLLSHRVLEIAELLSAK